MSLVRRCTECDAGEHESHHDSCSRANPAPQPLNVDAPPVTAKEADFLAIYHLRMAAMYFEATDENLCERLPADEFSRSAMAAWVESMEALYPED